MPELDKLVANWLRKADHDLGTAKAAAEKLYYDTGCYHCQQAVEKSIKAYVIYKNRDFARTHDLEKLCNDAAIIDGRWNDHLIAVSSLTQFNVIGRYPTDEEDPTLADFDAALKTAEMIYSFSKALIGLGS